MTKVEYEHLDIHEHPAILAWQQLSLTNKLPESIDRLFDYAEDKKKNKLKNKSALFRLVNILPDGNNIIAKRCKANIALTEQYVYENIFKKLDITHATYFGEIKDRDPSFHWLFIADAGEVQFDPKNVLHKSVAIQWLVDFHGQSSQNLIPAKIQKNTTDSYSSILKETLSFIDAGMSNEALNNKDRQLLNIIQNRCHQITEQLDNILEFCESFPSCLVHSDFVPKNIRVKNYNDETILIPFDWETIAWGAPAADLGSLLDMTGPSGIKEYWRRSHVYWPNITLNQLERLADIGIVLRIIYAIYWASRSLPYEWPQRALNSLLVYESSLSKQLSKLDFIKE